MKNDFDVAWGITRRTWRSTLQDMAKGLSLHFMAIYVMDEFDQWLLFCYK